MMRVAIVGASQTAFGDLPELSIKELFLQAYEGLLASVDKGIDPAQIEAAFIGTLGVGGFQLGQAAPLLTSYVGLPNIPTTRIENACVSGSLALLNAVYSILSGEYEVVLVAGIEKMRDMSTMQTKYWLGVSGDTEYERLAGLTFAAIYALMANRYFADYQATKEHLSKIAVKNHRNGAQNPKAQFQREITLDRALRGPNVASPLNLYDCCSITDGAAALLVVNGKRANEFTDNPVYIAGWGTASDYLAVHDRETITGVKATSIAAQKAYQRAGITPKDVSVAEVHDCFTIAELMAYSDLGFCDKHEAHILLDEGFFDLDGELPVNPSGGLKAKGHPVGATGTGQIYEIYHQLRGTADRPSRQVGEAKVGLTHNVGGSGGSVVVAVYRR